MRRIGLWALLLLLVAVAVGLGFFWPFGQPNNVLRLPGVVEVQEVRLGSKIGGRVAEVSMVEGAIVETGHVLVRFEQPELEAQAAQQRARIAALAEARAKLKEIEANLAEAFVRAPERAVVEIVGVRKGDLVPPNTPVVRVLRADDLWVKVYVPETELGKVQLEQKVTVTIDSYPDR